MSDIASRVKAIIVDKLGVDENEVVTEASFTKLKGARKNADHEKIADNFLVIGMIP
jgi:hypothetical protein